MVPLARPKSRWTRPPCRIRSPNRRLLRSKRLPPMRRRWRSPRPLTLRPPRRSLRRLTQLQPRRRGPTPGPSQSRWPLPRLPRLPRLRSSPRILPRQRRPSQRRRPRRRGSSPHHTRRRSRFTGAFAGGSTCVGGPAGEARRLERRPTAGVEPGCSAARDRHGRKTHAAAPLAHAGAARSGRYEHVAPPRASARHEHRNDDPHLAGAPGSRGRGPARAAGDGGRRILLARRRKAPPEARPPLVVVLDEPAEEPDTDPAGVPLRWTHARPAPIATGANPRGRRLARCRRPAPHRPCAGFAVPADIFARYQRLRGNDVLMVSGTDEHGTPVMVVADREGRRRVRPRTSTTS